MKKQLYINGEWVEASTYMPLYSPYSEAHIADIPKATTEEVDQAIQAADAATRVMAEMPAYQRADILYQLAEKLAERKDEAARIIALEAAKPFATAKGEVARTIETYRFAAEEAKRIHGETIPLDASASGTGRIAYTVRKPIGVIGAITPFNFR